MLEELTHIITDPAHLVAEAISEGVFFLAGVIYVKVKLRKRDQEHNHEEP